MLKIAVSSRALFNVEDGDKVFRQEGQEAFDEYMRSKEDTPLRPGAAFGLVRKLLGLNARLPQPLVKVALMSRNSPDAGMRVANSIEHYGLDISQAVFSKGADRFRYAAAVGAHLFLSANPSEVASALEFGLAAACVQPQDSSVALDDDVVRIAFDGDSVLFSHESDEVFRAHGLERFQEHEISNARVPLTPGPFKTVLEALHRVQVALNDRENPRLRICLATARGRKVYARVVHTFRSWGIYVDEALFCDGEEKGPLLKAFGADIFFDDSPRNIESAQKHSVPSGHVPNGNGVALGHPAH